MDGIAVYLLKRTGKMNNYVLVVLVVLDVFLVLVVRIGTRSTRSTRTCTRYASCLSFAGGLNASKTRSQANVKECRLVHGWNDAQIEALKVVKTGLKRHFMLSIIDIVETIRSKKHVFINFSGIQGSYMPAFLR